MTLDIAAVFDIPAPTAPRFVCKYEDSEEEREHRVGKEELREEEGTAAGGLEA